MVTGYFRVLLTGLLCCGGVGAAGGLGKGAVAQPAPMPPSPTSATAGVSAGAQVGQPGEDQTMVLTAPQPGRGGSVYFPGNRRDPFLPIVRELGAGSEGAKKPRDLTVHPLQRVSVAELTVIGIVWDKFGYVAMVQTPDGKGYTVRPGTRIGNNNGVVRSITDKAVIIEERFTDIYGKKQVRVYTKPLRVEESLP